MTILLMMIPISLLLGLLFLLLFVWSVRSGQMDDLVTPAHKILTNNDSNNQSDKEKI